MRKQIGRISAGILLTCCLLSLGGCSKPAQVLDIHTSEQAQYLAGDYQLYKTYANGTEELSRPQAAELVLNSAKDGTGVYVSEHEDMTEATEYVAENGKLSMENLKVGCTYYYSINDGKNKVYSFSTADVAPRNLHVDGVTNVRDIGGWTIDGGAKVKQGVIFRSGKLSADDTGEALISEEGIRVLRDDLRIKTEIDLRTSDDLENGGIEVSVLGSGVRYVSVPIQSGGNIILLNRDSLKDLFAVFGDEANYPILFHCSIGTDRTGMVAFLINGLMGVGEEQLYRDFLFSNFGEIGKMRAPSIIKTYIDTVGMSSGSTLSEKICSYLTEAGVEASDIDTLKRMLTQ